ncbi:hypothetical protein [Sphingosinicella sp. BN140058]|uniref:hypothetical protein n=1 Tax=Sphingosinicella sp. BN140058 TaxID=1892855 RepID=UPI001010E34F|nr:hypothetical protein [Sphingosinicella sp. BN140058]QAY78677.1 hypothetical protein ETR14_20640 [Sphingosinicella sp. BN140058]
MIHVDSQSNNNGGWLAPRGCHPEPRSRDIHARQEDTSALWAKALLKDRFHPLILPLLRDLRALRAFATK